LINTGQNSPLKNVAFLSSKVVNSYGKHKIEDVIALSDADAKKTLKTSFQ
jgi:hypothetical protein